MVMLIVFGALELCTARCGGGQGGASVSVDAISAKKKAVFTAIDGPGGGPTTLNGIDIRGDIVGFTTNEGANLNFKRGADGVTTLVDLGDPAAMANAINAKGAIVGVANNAAFILSDGRESTLSPPGSQSSIAFGINDRGAVVGQYVNADNVTPGFVEIGGAFTTIRPTADASVTNVQGINNEGLAVGFFSTDGVHQHGFLYDTHTNRSKVLPDPSTARTAADGLVLTQFLALDDDGNAVGYYQTNNGSQFGFIFDLRRMEYTFFDAPGAVPIDDVQITQITGINHFEMTGFFVGDQGLQHGFIALKSP
jgi:hypothetical protein